MQRRIGLLWPPWITVLPVVTVDELMRHMADVMQCTAAALRLYWFSAAGHAPIYACECCARVYVIAACLLKF